MKAYESLIASGVGSALQPEDASSLHRLVEERRPLRCLEIGMANGVSTLAILEALPPDGVLVSVDPHQSSDWESTGSLAVEEAGFAARHRLLEEADHVAMPRLVSEGERFDLVFIDGWHSFDYVMLDIFYGDLLVRPGGVIGFDDCEMEATRRALRFLATHRPYIELVAGPVRYVAGSPLKRGL